MANTAKPARRSHAVANDSARGRVSARLPKALQSRLAAAAELVGATVNQFMVQAALEKAEQVIEHERVIKLSTRDMKQLLAALDSPRPPNDRLQAALVRHRELMRGASNRTAA